MSGIIRILVRLLSLPAAFVIGSTIINTSVANAEEASNFVEEVIVQARKRPEELQEVPISITAFSEETIERMYANDVGEFSKYTPNVILARQPYAGNALFGGMRGIVFGDLEKSFDPAVGVVVDGVALVNNTGALIDTFDLESVEILRGPQGTLFGRNTAAGVVNVRRSRPTGEFGLKTQFRYASHNETDLKAVLNLAPSNTVSLKLAAFLDKGDGYQEKATVNLTTGEISGTGDDIEGEDTFNFYGSLLWEPSDNFDALFTYEHTDDDSTLSTPTNMTAPTKRDQWGKITADMFAGLAAMNDLAVPIAIGTALAGGGNFCDVTGAVIAPLNGWNSDLGCNTYGQLLGESNGYKYSVTAQDFINNIESNAYTLEMNYNRDDLTFTSITSYRESEELLDEDNLGAPIELFNPYRPQDYDQFSTELRVASDYGGKFNFVAGFYHLQSSYEITATVWVFGAFGATRETGGAPGQDGDSGQDITASALFGEVYYDLTDKARLTLGGRWTTEEKEFFTFQRVSADATQTITPRTWGCGNISASEQAIVDRIGAAWIAASPDAAAAAARPGRLACQDGDGNEDWQEFTPRLSFDYRFTPDVMGYASYAKGFRSGGWNGRATTPQSIGPYEPEIVDSYEVGFRTSFLDGALLANLTFFHQDYQDKHESTIYAFGMATETLVNNAAEATIQGIEFEMRYLLAENVQLRMAFGQTDGEYDEFLTPVDRNNRSGPQMDISDTYAFAFAPEYNFSIGIDAVQELADMGSIWFSGNLSWADETVGNFGLPDPQGLGRNNFEARETLDISATWRNPWVDVAIYGRNLTQNDNYLATGVDVGVFYFGSVAPGRTFGIELTREW